MRAIRRIRGGRWSGDVPGNRRRELHVHLEESLKTVWGRREIKQNHTSATAHYFGGVGGTKDLERFAYSGSRTKHFVARDPEIKTHRSPIQLASASCF